MKIVKPDSLSLLHSVFPQIPGIHGGTTLSVAVLAGFRLSESPDIPMLLENDIWQAIQKALPDEEILDSGLPKPRSEYLVYGNCHAKKPVCVRKIDIRVAHLRKRLTVFGARFRRGDESTHPEPFTRMPIVWQNAYGGSGFIYNPVGMGHPPISDGLNGVTLPCDPLPHVEDLSQISVFSAHTDYPAGLSAMPSHWPQRRVHLGTLDADWQEKNWPGLPRDYSLEYAFTAPMDQRFDGYLQGGEPVAVAGMHPEKEMVSGFLPRLRCRVFIQRRDLRDGAVEEIDTHLETLWLFPELETGVVLWRGVAATVDEDCGDIARLIVGHEPLDAIARPAAYYLQTASRQSADTIPDQETTLPDPDTSRTAKTASSVEENPLSAHIVTLETAVSHELARMGVNKDQVNDFLKRSASFWDTGPVSPKKNGSETLMQQLESQVQKIKAATDAQLRGQNLNPVTVEKQLAEKIPGQNFENRFIERLKALADRKDLPDAVRAEAGRSLAGFMDLQAIVAQLGDGAQPKHAGSTVRVETPLMPPVTRLTTPEALERLRNRGELTGCDLGQCDFSGLNLAGANLSAAILQDVSWPGVDLTEANLSGAFCQNANLTRAVLTRANLTGTILENACLENCLARDCVAHRAQFPGADLKGAFLKNADFENADFSRADLRHANLSGLKGRGVRLNGARLDEATFNRADLSHSRADAATIACRARFQKARLTGIRWGGIHLDGADLTKSDLDGADLSHADLSRAILKKVSAREATLSHAVLKQANLFGINLLLGSLRQADCSGAWIQNANLFGVDLYRCRFSQYQFVDVNLGRTRLRPAGVIKDSFEC
ncbi:MAG: DUF2169 domain-containing protein [Desulfatirhabdiaceae bacterium]